MQVKRFTYFFLVFALLLTSVTPAFAAETTGARVRRPRSIRPAEENEKVATFAFYKSKEAMDTAKGRYEQGQGISEEGLVSKQNLDETRYPANVLYEPPFDEYALTHFLGWHYMDGSTEKRVNFGTPIGTIEKKVYFAYPKYEDSRHVTLVYGGVVVGSVPMNDDGTVDSARAMRIAGSTKSLQNKAIRGWATAQEKTYEDAVEHQTIVHLKGEDRGETPTKFEINETLYPIVADIYPVRFYMGEFPGNVGINLPLAGAEEVEGTLYTTVPVPTKGGTFTPGTAQNGWKNSFTGGTDYTTWGQSSENKTGYLLKGWYTLEKNPSGGEKIRVELVEKDGIFYRKSKDGSATEPYKIHGFTNFYADLEGVETTYRVIFMREKRPADNYRSDKGPEGAHYTYYGDPTVYSEKQYEYFTAYETKDHRDQEEINKILTGKVGSWLEISEVKTSDGKKTIVQPNPEGKNAFPSWESFGGALFNTEDDYLGYHYNWEKTKTKLQEYVQKKEDFARLNEKGTGSMIIYLDRDDVEMHFYTPRGEGYSIYKGYVYGQDSGTSFMKINEDLVRRYAREAKESGEGITALEFNVPSSNILATNGSNAQLIPTTLERDIKTKNHRNFWKPGTDLSALHAVNPEVPARNDHAWIQGMVYSPYHNSDPGRVYAFMPLEWKGEIPSGYGDILPFHKALEAEVGPIDEFFVRATYPEKKAQTILDKYAIYLGETPYAFMTQVSLRASTGLSAEELKPFPGFTIMERSQGNRVLQLSQTHSMPNRFPRLSTVIWDIVNNEVDKDLWKPWIRVFPHYLDEEEKTILDNFWDDQEQLYARWLDVHNEKSWVRTNVSGGGQVEEFRKANLEEFLRGLNKSSSPGETDDRDRPFTGTYFELWKEEPIPVDELEEGMEEGNQKYTTGYRAYSHQNPLVLFYTRDQYRLFFETGDKVLPNMTFEGLPFQAPIIGGAVTDRAHVADGTQQQIKAYMDGFVKVQFDSETGELLNPKTVTRNSQGDYFAGWALDPAGANPFNPEEMKVPEHDVRVFARWTKHEVKVRFHEVPEGSLGADGPESITLTEKFPAGGVVEDPGLAPANVPKGMSEENFLGWYKKGAAYPFSFVNPVMKNVDLYPKWAPREARIAYIFDYDMQGSNNPDTRNLKLLSDQDFLSFVRDLGKGRGTDDINKDFDGVLKLSELSYAQRKNLYVRSPLGYTDPAPVTGKGDKVVHPEGKAGTKSEGHVFLGWKMYFRDENTGTWRPIDDDETRFYTNSLFNADSNNISHNNYAEVLFFVAQWGEKMGDTSVTFHGNNGVDPEPTYLRSVRVGDEIVLPTLEEPVEKDGQSTTLKALGFTKTVNGKEQIFVGWSAERDGKYTLYKPGDTVRIDAVREETSNHLYAIWKPAMPIQLTKVWVNGDAKPGYKVGLLVRDPANPGASAMNGFRVLPDTLQDLPKGTEAVHWDVPQTNAKGDTLRYMAIEVAPGEEETFKSAMSWEDLHAKVSEEGGVRTKEQTFGQGKDAITSATVRQASTIDGVSGYIIRMTNTLVKPESNGPEVKGPDGQEPKAGDESLKITPSSEATKVTITVPGENGQPTTITLTKNKNGTWTDSRNPDTPINAGDGGVIELPVPPLVPGEKVTATQEEPGKEPGTTEVIVKRDPTAPPKVKVPKEGDKTLEVSPPPGADTVTITIPNPDGTAGKTITIEKNKDGNTWTGPNGTISPGNGGTLQIPMENTDIQNGKPIVITAQDKTHHKDPSSSVVITPGKAQTTPANTTEQETGTDRAVIVTGKTEPGANVTVTTPSGEVVHGKADKEGNFTVEIPREKLKENEGKVTIITQVDGKNPSDPVEVRIDHNGPNPPTIKTPTEGDESVTITPDADTKVITVQLPNGDAVTLTKNDNGTWTDSRNPDAPITPTGDNGAFILQTPPLETNQTVTAKGYDELGNPSTPTNTTVSPKQPTPAPEVNPTPVKGDKEVPVIPSPDATTIRVTIPGDPATTVTVTKDEKGNWKTDDGTDVRTDGNTVYVPTPALESGKVITVTQQEPGKDPGVTHVAVDRGDPTPVPKVEKPTPGDKELVVTPQGNTDKVTITLPPVKEGDPAKVITLTKNPDPNNNTWISDQDPNTPITPGANGELHVPIPEEDQPRIQTGVPITVVGEDGEHGRDPSTPATVIPGVADSKPPKSVNQGKGDDSLIRITGEGEPGSTIVVRDPKTGETFLTKVDSNRKYVVPIEREKLGDGNNLEVIQQEPGKNPSTPTSITIDREGPQAPIPTQPTEGDEKITVDPKDADTLVITHPDGRTVTYMKDPTAEHGWKPSEPNYPVLGKNDDGSIVVKTPKLKDDERITVKGYDELRNPSTPTNTTVREKDQTKQPDVERPAGGDTTLKVKPNDPNAPAGSIITVNVEGQNPFTLTKNDDGTWTDSRNPDAPITPTGDAIPVPVDPLVGEKVITVTQQDPGMKESTPKIVPVTKTRTEKPKVENPTAGEDTLKVTPPKDADKVTITFDDGSKVVVPKNEDGTWKGPNGPITPDSNTGEIRVPVDPDKVKNGSPITVTAQNEKGNKEVSDGTVVIPGALQSAEPTESKQVPGDDNTIVVTGKGESGAKITVTTPNGKDVTVTVGDDNTFTVPIPRTYFGDNDPSTVTITQTSKDKTESPGVSLVIDRKGPDAPVFDEPTADDTTVTFDPKDADSVVVTAPGGKTIILTKDDDGNWRSNAPDYPATNGDDGKIVITPKDPVKVNDDWSAKGYDEMKNPSDSGFTKARDKDQTAVPTIDPTKAGDDTIAITPGTDGNTPVPEGSVITVTVPKGTGGEETITLTKGPNDTWTSDKNPGTPIKADPNGKILVPVAPLAPEQIVTVTQQDPNKKVSTPAKVLVTREKTEKPSAETPTAHDENLVITPPAKSDTITITLPPDKDQPGDAPKTVTLTKNPNGDWVREDEPGTVLKNDGGKLTVSMKDDEKKRIQRDTPITITAQDKGHNFDPSEPLVLLPGAETTAPVDKTVQNEGNDQKITLTGHAEPNSIVTITTPSGETFTTTAKDNGDYSVDIPRDRLKDGDDSVTIKAQAPRKNESTEVTQNIDKNGPAAPDIDPMTDGETKVLITPKDDSSTIVVELPDGKIVTLEKKGNDWTSSDPTNNPVSMEGDKIALTTPVLEVNQKVFAKAYDDLGNPSDRSSNTVQAKNPTPAPGLEKPQAGDETLTITPDPNAPKNTTLVVKVPSADGTEKTITLTKDDNGNWINQDDPKNPIVPENGKVKVPVEPLDPRTTITVTQEEPGKTPTSTTEDVTPVPTNDPTVKTPEEGDNHIDVLPPADADTITVTLPGGEKVVVNKTPDGWKSPDGKTLTPDKDGYIPVPVDPEKVIKNIPINVTTQDKEHKKDPSNSVPVTPTERGTLPVPVFETVHKGDTTVGVTPPEGADGMTITFPGGKTTELQKQPDGSWVPVVDGKPDTANPIKEDPPKSGVLVIPLPDGTKLTEQDTIGADAKDSTGTKKPSHGETTVSDKEKLDAPDLLPPDRADKTISFKPKDHADKTVITVTDKNGTPTTLTVVKGQDGNWTLEGDPTPLQVDGNGWIAVPYKGFEGGEKISAHHEDSTNTYDPSDERATTVSGTTQTPDAPKVTIDNPAIHRDSPSLTLTPDNADKITVTIPAEGGDKTITLEKGDDGNWTSDDLTFTPALDNGKIVVTIPDSVHLEVGKDVTVVGENEVGAGEPDTKEVTPDGPSAKPTTPVQEPKRDGFVPITSTTTEPNPDGTYTLVDKNGDPITDNGKPDGNPITATPDKDGKLTFLVPDGILKDGDPVGVRVEEPGKTPNESDKILIDGKGPNVLVEGPVRPADKTISLIPDDAESITVKIPTDGGDKTVTLEKGDNGWTSSDPNFPVKEDGGKLLIGVPENTTLKGGKPITAKGKDPLGNEGREDTTYVTDSTDEGTNPPIIPVEKDPNTGEDVPTPQGMVKLTFEADPSYGHLLHHGEKTSRVSYFVDPGFPVSADFAPTIVAEDGYSVAGRSWTMDLPATITQDTTIYARFVKDEATTPPVSPGTDEGEIPEGYHRVVFVADPNQADLRGQTVYFVKDGTEIGYDKAPAIYPKNGYGLQDEPWSVRLPIIVNSDVTIHAQLKRVQDYVPVQPVEPSGPSIVHPIPLIVNPVKEVVKYVEKDANIQIHKAYVFGYPDGSFRPERSISRGEVAAIFTRLITGQDNQLNHATAYSDVTANMWYSGAIHFLSEKKVLTGYPDGSFRPDAPITRAEFATIVAKVKALRGESASFPDVAGHWADGAIGAVAHAGYVTGYPDGSFMPDKNITRAEAVTITNKMLDRQGDHGFITTTHDIVRYNDVAESHWAFDNIYEASVTHLYSRPDGTLHQEAWKKIVKKEDLLGGLLAA